MSERNSKTDKGRREVRGTSTRAPKEQTRHLDQMKILALFGKVDYDPQYDHKRQRAKG